MVDGTPSRTNRGTLAGGAGEATGQPRRKLVEDVAQTVHPAERAEVRRPTLGLALLALLAAAAGAHRHAHPLHHLLHLLELLDELVHVGDRGAAAVGHAGAPAAV